MPRFARSSVALIPRLAFIAALTIALVPRLTFIA